MHLLTVISEANLFVVTASFGHRFFFDLFSGLAEGDVVRRRDAEHRHVQRRSSSALLSQASDGCPRVVNARSQRAQRMRTR